jgi:RHS repeat-associated protein
MYTYASSGPGEGMLASIQDPMSSVTSFSRDIFGRVLSETRSGASTVFTWDATGNLTSVTPPSQPVHNMTYTPVNLLEQYAPPATGLPQPATAYTYNPDRQLTSIQRPDGLAITRAYNTGGKLESQTLPGGLVEHSYIPSGSGQGRLGNVLGPYGVDLSFDYDGALMTSMTWSGDVTGAVDWDFNSDFVPTLEAVTGASGTSAASFGYDQDLLTTCGSATTCPSGTGALVLTRSASNGLITQSDVGSLRETLTYNTFGELATQASTYSGSALLSLSYHAASFPRDANGRVVRKVETLNGTTHTWDYQYDAHDRLSDVSLDGTPVESFDYDGNGNRTGYWSPATGNVTATYDDQDRMLTYGDWQYDYGANGELRSKLHVPSGDETLYTYDVLGNLLSVTLPIGSLIEYLVDGMGRRVGKKVDGALVKQWLYRDSLKPAAELDGAGVLQTQFVYVAGKTAPDLVIAGGVTYRVLSDQLGSPRLVVNTADGSVVARMRHDAFGNVLEDSNPGFVPFGFAGGIYDVDTALVRFGARDYDAATGRWTSKDPIRFEGGVNLFAYANNDGINYVDSAGRGATLAVVVGAVCFAYDIYDQVTDFTDLDKQIEEIEEIQREMNVCAEQEDYDRLLEMERERIRKMQEYTAAQGESKVKGIWTTFGCAALASIAWYLP